MRGRVFIFSHWLIRTRVFSGFASRKVIVMMPAERVNLELLFIESILLVLRSTLILGAWGIHRSIWVLRSTEFRHTRPDLVVKVLTSTGDQTHWVLFQCLIICSSSTYSSLMRARLRLYTYTEECTRTTNTKWKNDWLLRIYNLTTAKVAYPDKDELSRSVYKIL